MIRITSLIKYIDKKFCSGFFLNTFDFFFRYKFLMLMKNNNRSITIFYNSNNNFLTKISDKNLCDKGSKNIKDLNEWGYISHTYTEFYNLLFGHFKNNAKLIFELGISLGRSLRMWEKYFTNAHIYAGDIDRSLLFQKKRIHTYYCDQLCKKSINNMWKKIKKKNFDLIIDDGLHTNEANINFFENSFKYLRPDGMFIIEDIKNDSLLELSKYFKKYNPQIITLKARDTRYPDNNLILFNKI